MSAHGFVDYGNGYMRPRTCEEGEAAAVARERTLIAVWCEGQAAWCMAHQPPRREEASVWRRFAAQIRRDAP